MPLKKSKAAEFVDIRASEKTHGFDFIRKATSQEAIAVRACWLPKILLRNLVKNF